MRTIVVMMSALALLCAPLLSGCKDKEPSPPAKEKAAGENEEEADEGEEEEAAAPVVKTLGQEGQKIKMIRNPQQVKDEVGEIMKNRAERTKRLSGQQ